MCGSSTPSSTSISPESTKPRNPLLNSLRSNTLVYRTSSKYALSTKIKQIVAQDQSLFLLTSHKIYTLPIAYLKNEIHNETTDLTLNPDLREIFAFQSDISFIAPSATQLLVAINHSLYFLDPANDYSIAKYLTLPT